VWKHSNQWLQNVGLNHHRREYSWNHLVRGWLEHSEKSSVQGWVEHSEKSSVQGRVEHSKKRSVQGWGCHLATPLSGSLECGSLEWFPHHWAFSVLNHLNLAMKCDPTWWPWTRSLARTRPSLSTRNLGFLKKSHWDHCLFDGKEQMRRDSPGYRCLVVRK
jgi:hypothetical protein